MKERRQSRFLREVMQRHREEDRDTLRHNAGSDTIELIDEILATQAEIAASHHAERTSWRETEIELRERIRTLEEAHELACRSIARKRA